MSEGSAARAAVARAVAAVIGAGETLDAALPPALAALAPAERAQAQALAYGALRFGHRLKRVCDALLERPWDRHAPELQALLLVGLWQLEYSKTPPHAAVSTVVEAARLVGQERATGLVNACLRRFQRERAALLKDADGPPAGRHSYPEWLVSRLAGEAGSREALEALLAAGNVAPPLVLRANARRIATGELADRLEALGHVVHQVPFAPRALVLEQALDVRELAEFREGLCSVQDAAAQLAAPLVGAGAGMSVLDACAAPGGKACHLLEEHPNLGSLVALDLDGARARRIGENLERLGLSAEVVVGDATDPQVLEGRSFDRILLDAPCSGTGVIRRHPDIKWLRRPADIGPLAARQRRLLEALWPRLRPGGRLIYAVCSVLAAEGPAVVRAFQASTPGAVDVTESASLALPALPARRTAGETGLRLMPGLGGTDGFYYACLERSAHGSAGLTGTALRPT